MERVLNLQGREASPRPPLVAAREDREFVYTSRDFERVRRLIRDRTGIALADGKADMVYGRLARRLRTLRLERFADYLDHLESAGDEAEWQAFTNALTTNLTAFFREAHHFEHLKSRLAEWSQQHAVTIWCAAASTGEEPYSLALSAIEQFDSPTPPVRIIATDIDTQVLETASNGIYPIERIERLDRERVRAGFLRGQGDNAGRCRVRPELQALIEFRPLNLLDKVWDLKGPFDAIFCRNVMIYFDKPTQYRILERFVPLLRPDGLLYAGHSESFFHAADLFQSVGRTIYRRADARPRS